MSSAFQYYGTKEEVLNYLIKTIRDDHFQKMITQMSDEWRNAVYYVLGRGPNKSRLYLETMFEAHEAGILDKINPELVKGGTAYFADIVGKAMC